MSLILRNCLIFFLFFSKMINVQSLANIIRSWLASFQRRSWSWSHLNVLHPIKFFEKILILLDISSTPSDLNFILKKLFKFARNYNYKKPNNFQWSFIIVNIFCHFMKIFLWYSVNYMVISFIRSFVSKLRAVFLFYFNLFLKLKINNLFKVLI